MLAELDGVAVTIGAVTVQGKQDHTSERFLADAPAAPTVLQERSVLVRTGVFASVAQGTAITVAGVAYTIREALPESPDGALTRIYLRRA